MDFLTNMENMFGSDYKEELALQKANDSVNELEEINKFFSSRSGKAFLACIEDAKSVLYEQLESCNPDELVKVQANLKAIKLVYTLLEEKIEDLDDLKKTIIRAGSSS